MKVRIRNIIRSGPYKISLKCLQLKITPVSYLVSGQLKVYVILLVYLLFNIELHTVRYTDKQHFTVADMS
jgi:hypothetical protein